MVIAALALTTGADYRRFAIMARSSVYELLTQIEICERLDLDGNWPQVKTSTNNLSRLLQGLISSLTLP